MRTWKHHMNIGHIWGNDDLTFEQRRDAIVATIQQQSWFKNLEWDDSDDEDMLMLVEELADTDTPDYFDVCWDGVYDYADANRIWIDLYKEGTA